MTIASTYCQACLEAWINCETLLKKISGKKSLSSKVSKVIDECAHICMGTFHALKNQSGNFHKFALLCVGICEECAEACDTINDEEFRQCASACRACSYTMSDIASLAI